MSADIFELHEPDQSVLQGERARILTMLRGAIPFANIKEVGSTAVDGVVGKQDVDFAVSVRPERFDDAREVLDGLFARNDRQLSNAEFQGYIVPSSLDVSVQLFHAEGRYDVFDAFLDLLIGDESLRRRYNDLKSAWNGRPMKDYRAAKDAFIESALKGTDLSSRNLPPRVG